MKDNKRLDYDEFDINELADIIADRVGESSKSSFEDIVNLEGSLNREIYLGDIYPCTGQTVSGYIRYWNNYDAKNHIPVEERQPIKIYVNSCGGSLVESFIMIDSIRMSKTPVWTIAVGAVYSGGFFTFITGHKRIAYPHASFLYHEGSTATSADAGKFRNYADFYQKQLEQLKDITLKYTDMTPEYYKEHQRDDLWLTADEALELGVCDEVAGELY